MSIESIMLPVYEMVGDILESHGEHEFTVTPARHDIIQIAVDGQYVGMRVVRIEHRIAHILNIPLQRRVLTTLVIVKRATHSTHPR